MLTAVAADPAGKCLSYPLKIVQPNGSTLASKSGCGTTFHE